MESFRVNSVVFTSDVALTYLAKRTGNVYNRNILDRPKLTSPLYYTIDVLHIKQKKKNSFI